MLTTPKVPQALASQLIGQYDEPNVGQGTHLTVDSKCIIEANHLVNRSQKSGRARDGVDL